MRLSGSAGAVVAVPGVNPSPDQDFAEALRRACRQPQGRSLLMLHLSRMAPPAPRPHHRRIARAVLQDVAQRYEGQVFALTNGDFALLCLSSGLTVSLGRRMSETAQARPASEFDLMSLPDVLARLLRVDAPDPATILSIWPIERAPETMLSLVKAAVTESEAGEPGASAFVEPDPHEARHPLAGPPGMARPELARPELARPELARPGHARKAGSTTNGRVVGGVPPAWPSSSPTSTAHSLGKLIDVGNLHDLIQRQTAVFFTSPLPLDGFLRGERGLTTAALDGPGGLGPGKEDAGSLGGWSQVDAALAGGMPQPLYREIDFPMAALEARIASQHRASTDPFLLRHLSGRLDLRLLDAFSDALHSGSPLDLFASHAAGTPLRPHLNLTLAGIAAPGFRRLVDTCRSAGMTIGIEVAVVEACANSRAFRAARDIVREAGMVIVIDGVSHLALRFAAVETLDPDLLKLEWSPRLADQPDAEAAIVLASIEAIGAERIVLYHAETEAALQWGLARGIQRFQGRHVDGLLGAGRIAACPRASACTLRQCIERASATSLVGRSGCDNMPLLDAVVPARHTEPARRLPLRQINGSVRTELAGGRRPGSAAARFGARMSVL